MTDHLFWDFLHKSFSVEEFRRYTASDQSSTASRRLLTSDLWEYAGIRWRDVQETWERGKMIHSRARWNWFGISTDVIVSCMFIMSAATYLEFVNVTSALQLVHRPRDGLAERYYLSRELDHPSCSTKGYTPRSKGYPGQLP